ncbi:MAG: uncharacterized membrane protein YgdD (TMEM256/DUF423 family) [Kiritimatiellia bacterium]|jgi:uncharacterized membrane protein YgdD (TMEM256/DUF423 family)
MKRPILISAALLGMTAVILGAFGAHGLKELLSPEQLSSFETGVRYQMYHALVLLGITALFSEKLKIVKIMYGCFLAGTLLFSGSIYVLSCRDLLGGLNVRWLGPVTPLGGVLLIVGWACMLVAACREKR